MCGHPSEGCTDEGMTMTTVAEPTTGVTAGADTHRDQHVVAALDARGAELGVRPFATSPAGLRALLAWLRGFGTVERVGVEGTGSYGAVLHISKFWRQEDLKNQNHYYLNMELTSRQQSSGKMDLTMSKNK